MVTSHRFEPDSKNRLIVKGAALGALGNFFYFFIKVSKMANVAFYQYLFYRYNLFSTRFVMAPCPCAKDDQQCGH